MKVLVAGGTGVVGAALVQHLEQRGAGVTVLSRTPVDHPNWVPGDVRSPNLGLPPEIAQRLRSETTHVVSCFGSVHLDAGPQSARSLHGQGTKNLLSFFADCRDPQRFLHVSSVLVAGRATRAFGNADLDVGQSFRSWYEYGKFQAELEVRRASSRLPVRVIRFGPVLGGDGPTLPRYHSGLPSVLPYLLKQLPIFIANRGEFPSYASDSVAAAAMAAEALFATEGPMTWTYFDPTVVTLNQTLTGLCAAWNVVPRIFASNRLLKEISGVLGPKVGLPHVLAEYLQPWARFGSELLDELPVPAERGPDRFVERTSFALRAKNPEEMTA